MTTVSDKNKVFLLTVVAAVDTQRNRNKGETNTTTFSVLVSGAVAANASCHSLADLDYGHTSSRAGRGAAPRRF